MPKALLSISQSWLFVFLWIYWVPWVGHVYGQVDFPTALPEISDGKTPFQVEDMVVGYGLNSSEISEIFQDHEGFIWVGNKPGLSRFDGYTFKNITQAEGRPLGQIHSIVQDDEYNLWAAGDGGLFWYDKGKFKTDLDIL